MNSRPVFFVHVMKTGGATFRQHVRNNFGPGETYPDKQLDTRSDNLQANTDVAYLLGLGPERRERIQVYMGHFPFVVTELLGVNPLTLTILRDPVERTISYLKHCKRYHPQQRHLTLEEIYEDPWLNPFFIKNHQTKVFSMTTADRLESLIEVIEIDDKRLQIACDNVEKIDVLGLNEHYGEFIAQLQSQLGWRFDEIPSRHVSDEPWQVSDEFRQRIAAENSYDVAFYQHARNVYLQRRAASGRISA